MSRIEVPRYIVVEGPIGVGKTSLSRRLAHSLNGELLLEGADANPFLEKFLEFSRTIFALNIANSAEYIP